ncbi:hypothetical protein LCGC14_2789850, partial [marine sediment metagenome]
DLKSKLVELKNQGKKVAAFGASAKGCILLNSAQIGKDLLECIFDDNENKNELMYPNLKPKIKHLAERERLKNKDILILALDSLRLIIPRLVDLSPRKIIIPLDIA